MHPGEGSVFRLANGNWACQISIGGRQGRRIVRRTSRAWTRKRDALDALKQLREEHGAGLPLPARMTTGDYLARWVHDARNIRPSTRHGYQVAIERHLVPELGSVALRDLSPMHVERMLTALAPRMSPKHLRNVHAVLRRALNQASRAGLVTRNVAAREFVDAPRVPVEEPQALDAAEVRRLLSAAAGDPVEPLITLALGTGLRQGELLGLAWEDVDLERGLLHIRRELARLDGRYVRAELKTERSRRIVPLAPALVAMLQAHRASLIERGFMPTRTGPVFVNRRGGPLSGSWLTHRLYALLEAAGVRRIPWKNLRTTFASRLFEAGIPDRRIADLLGHTRTTTTQGHYIGTAGTDQDAAIAAVQELVG